MYKDSLSFVSFSYYYYYWEIRQEKETDRLLQVFDKRATFPPSLSLFPIWNWPDHSIDTTFFQLKFTYLLLTGTRSILYVESHTVTIGACVFLRFSCSWRTNVSSGRKRGGAGRWNAQIDMFGCCCCCCHALLSVEAKKRKERREASGVKPVRTWMFITEGERTWTTTSLHSLTSR